MQEGAIEITKVEAGDLASPVLAQIDDIFFAAASRTYQPGPERDAFRERWLGRYLQGGSDALFLAKQGHTVAGYLVGAVENPALQERFADMATCAPTSPICAGSFRRICTSTWPRPFAATASAPT
ncbi:MAG TPA: hypothetical protein VHI72_06400 [Hyphomicrobiaceae bacterium]|jgi:hypothetical protein|nr:hypothetical protein [Hyphomicrobiaceae bacterium]